MDSMVVNVVHFFEISSRPPSTQHIKVSFSFIYVFFRLKKVYVVKKNIVFIFKALEVSFAEVLLAHQLVRSYTIQSGNHLLC